MKKKAHVMKLGDRKHSQKHAVRLKINKLLAGDKL